MTRPPLYRHQETACQNPMYQARHRCCAGSRPIREGNDYYQMKPQVVQLLSIGCVAVFFTLFWRKGGQTLGMQAWRIKLVDETGATPGTGRCLLRCGAALLSLLPAGLGYWWCLIDKRGLYWHDHLSGSHLLLLPKREK